MRLIQSISVLTAAFIMAAPAQAEILQMTSLYPAGNPVGNESKSVAIASFLGTHGDKLDVAIKRELTKATVNGLPYYDLSFYSSQRETDALLNGAADVDIYNSTTTGYKRICVEYDATKVFSGEEKEAKCTKHDTVEVDCTKRVITLDAKIMFVTANGNRPKFLEDYARTNEQTHCPGIDDNGLTSKKDEIRKLIQNLAVEIRKTLAPTERREKIRVLEKRKGMAKTQSSAFKAAVRMTKKDGREACRMWMEQGQNSPPHRSLNFNIALCTEQSGDLETALNQFRDTEVSFGKHRLITTARTRVARKIKAENDWEARRAVLGM